VVQARGTGTWYRHVVQARGTGVMGRQVFTMIVQLFAKIIIRK
jgi:hypothetical protein